MSIDAAVIVTAEGWGPMVSAALSLGRPVTAVVIGPRSLADAVATSGVTNVQLVEPDSGVPVEAYASGIAAVLADSAPAVVMSTALPAARVVLGAVAVGLGAALVPDVVAVAAREGTIVAQRAMVGGGTIVSVEAPGAIAVIYDGGEDEPDPQTPAPVESMQVPAARMAVVDTRPAGPASGLDDAGRVVSFGRGVRAKQDVDLIRQLAAALDAEIACSMPIADDLGWLSKERYVGRSGSHITPQLYLAVGIGGAPSTWRGFVVRGSSPLSTTIRRRASFTWPTTGSSVICTRSFPPSSQPSSSNNHRSWRTS